MSNWMTIPISGTRENEAIIAAATFQTQLEMLLPRLRQIRHQRIDVLDQRMHVAIDNRHFFSFGEFGHSILPPVSDITF